MLSSQEAIYNTSQSLHMLLLWTHILANALRTISASLICWLCGWWNYFCLLIFKTLSVFPPWPGIKSITPTHDREWDKWPPLTVCQAVWPNVSQFLISFCFVFGHKQKDAEGKDRTVFDIPIFTEEFLNHSKGRSCPEWCSFLSKCFWTHFFQCVWCHSPLPK